MSGTRLPLNDSPVMFRLVAGCLFFFVFFLTCWFWPTVVSAQGKQEQIPYNVVAILDRNELGNPLHSPSQVMFDPSMDELYVQNGEEIVVYGPDYYPYIAFGKGRGAEKPRGMAVDRNGMLYLCQAAAGNNPALIRIFNAAFFPVRDILFKDFADAEKFIPNRVAVSQDGLIYVAASRMPGVLVMDQQGEVLRWLKPQGKFFAAGVLRGGEDDEKDLVSGENEKQEDAAKEESSSGDPFADFPADLIPKKKEVEVKKRVAKLRPVLIVDIDIDQEGHIYLLSETEGKVYVYSANEEFLYSFGIKGGSSGKLSRPRGLAVDEKKKCIYVIDYQRQTLVIFDLTGKYIQDFGGVGWGPGWFNYPTDIALNRNGDVIIADLLNKRVQVLNLQFQSRFPLFGANPELVEEKESPTASYAPESGVNKKPAEEGVDLPLVQPESPLKQDDSGAAVDSKDAVVPPLEEPLPEPISPSSAGEEESLSATGDDPSGPEVPSSGVSPEVGFTEEPIGANMDDVQ